MFAPIPAGLRSSSLILNVDDDDTALFVKSTLIKRAGFDVIEAGTGKAALQAVVDSQPDLVLLDVKLPDINGFEVSRQIRTLGGISPMILQVSMAYLLVSDQARGLTSGADAYLVGPVEPELLIANIKALLRTQAAEREMRSAGRQWQKTFDAISDCVAIVTPEGVVIRHNRAFLDLVRLPLGTDSYVRGKIQNALGPLDIEPGSFPHAVAYRTRRKETAEIQVGERWIRITSEPIISENGSINKLVVTLSDFSARKASELERAQLLLKEQRAKQQAEESERRFRTMAETMHQLVLTVDATGNVEYCNRRWSQQTGVGIEKLKGTSWTSIVCEADRADAEKAWQHSLATGETFECELRVRGIDKEKRWYICRALPEMDEWGRRPSWVITFTDIHAKRTRARTDLLLARSSELLASLDLEEYLPPVLQLLIPEFADYAAIFLDPSQTHTPFASTDSSVMLPGSAVQQVLTTGLAMITDLSLTQRSIADASGIHTCVLLPLNARGQVMGCLAIGCKTGREREGDKLEALHHFAEWLAATIDNARLFADAQRELIERKRVERELRESEQNLRITTESMPQIVWTANANGEIETFNHQWFELTGHALSDGTPWHDHLHEEDRERALKAWGGSVRTGEEFEFEFRLRRAIDGSYVWHLARALPVRDKSGHVVRWIGTFTDIDDKRRTEEQNVFLSQASKVLLNCLDTASIFERVRDFIVPQYADWLSLDLVDDNGESTRVISYHHDAAKLALLKQVYERYPSPKTAQYGYPRVIKTGRSQLISPLSPAIRDAIAKDPGHREILEQSGMRSMMCVPLVTRGRVIGCLTVAITERRRIFDQGDLLLIEDLATRIATSLDNVQLLATVLERAK